MSFNRLNNRGMCRSDPWINNRPRAPHFPSPTCRMMPMNVMPRNFNNNMFSFNCEDRRDQQTMNNSMCGDYRNVFASPSSPAFATPSFQNSFVNRNECYPVVNNGPIMSGTSETYPNRFVECSAREGEIEMDMQSHRQHNYQFQVVEDNYANRNFNQRPSSNKRRKKQQFKKNRNYKLRRYWRKRQKQINSERCNQNINKNVQNNNGEPFNDNGNLETYNEECSKLNNIVMNNELFNNCKSEIIDPENEINQQTPTATATSSQTFQGSSFQGTLHVTIQRGSRGRSVVKDQEVQQNNYQINNTYDKNVCPQMSTNDEQCDDNLDKQQEDNFVKEESPNMCQISDPVPLKKAFCNTCKCYFTGSAILHNKTIEHKKLRSALRPYCRYCKQYFHSPAKFVQHCKMKRHKEACEKILQQELSEARVQQNDSEDSDNSNENFAMNNNEKTDIGENSPVEEYENCPDNSNEIINVDNIKKESQEEFDSNENESNVEELNSNETASNVEELNSSETVSNLPQENNSRVRTVASKLLAKYNSEVPIGEHHLMPLTGLFCRLCRKFYVDKNVALTHCKSIDHYKNYQKYLLCLKRQNKKIKTEPEPDQDQDQDPDPDPDSDSDPDVVEA